MRMERGDDRVSSGTVCRCTRALEDGLVPAVNSVKDTDGSMHWTVEATQSIDGRENGHDARRRVTVRLRAG